MRSTLVAIATILLTAASNAAWSQCLSFEWKPRCSGVSKGVLKNICIYEITAKLKFDNGHVTMRDFSPFREYTFEFAQSNPATHLDFSYCSRKNHTNGLCNLTE